LSAAIDASHGELNHKNPESAIILEVLFWGRDFYEVCDVWDLNTSGLLSLRSRVDHHPFDVIVDY
jgi:hypothetical protein